MQETAKRKKYLDAAKGLGISLIVFGHLTNINNPVDLYIGTFKIVIFFVISGYLFYETGTLQRYSIRSFIKNRLQSLLLPYFLYSILLALYQSLIDLYNGRSFSQILDRVAGMAYKCLSLRGYSTLWFLPCLFLGQLFLYWSGKGMENCCGDFCQLLLWPHAWLSAVCFRPWRLY